MHVVTVESASFVTAPAGITADPSQQASVFDQLRQPMLWTWLDAAGMVRLHWLNHAAQQWLGCAREDLLTRPLQQVCSDDWVHDWCNQLRLTAQQQARREWLLSPGQQRMAAAVSMVLLPHCSGSDALMLSVVTIPTAAEAEQIALPAIAEHQPECVKVVDADGQVLQMNRAGLAMLGVQDVVTVNARGLHSFIHAEDRERYLQFHRSVSSGLVGKECFRLQGESSVLYVETQATPMRNPVDGGMRYVAITRNHTERFKARQALQHSEERLNFVLKAARIGRWILDPASGQLARTPECDQCLGYPSMREDLCYEVFLEHLHTQDRERVSSAVEQALRQAGELDQEFRVIWPDGSQHWLWARAAVEHDALEHSQRLSGILVDVSARRVAEVAARNANARFRFATEVSGDGIWEWDLASGTSIYSARWAQILGYQESEIGASRSEWSDRLHPQEREWVLGQVQQRFNETFSLEHRLRHKDGHWVWVRWRSMVSRRDEQGRPLQRIGTISDITAFKEHAERNEHLRQRLQLAVKGSGFGVWEYDLTTGEMFWDAQMYNIYGQALHEELPLMVRWRNSLNPQDMAVVDARFQSLMEGAIVDLFEFRITRATDGAERHIEANGYLQRDGSGRPQRLVGMNRDVTERWQADELVRLLGNSLPQLHDIVVVVENEGSEQARGRLRYANSAFFETSGYEPADLNRLVLRTLLSPAAHPLTVQALREAVAQLRTFNCELLGRCKSGLELWFDVTFSPVPDRHGAVTHWVMVAHEITERKAAEAAALEHRAELEWRVEDRTRQLQISNQELHTFTRAVAHDLRGPLRGISGWSQALHEDSGHLLDEPGMQHLQFIRSEARRLNDLLDGLLRLSRIVQMDLEISEVNLSEMATSIIRRLRQESPQRVVECTIASNVKVRGDAPLLFLALNNLLQNAWKFTATRTCGRIELRMQEGSGRCVLIRDNGVGFDPDYVREIFQPFRRLHRAEDYPGSGIGLATVELIMRRHGGVVQACGEPGVGASFELRFAEVPG